MQTSNRNRTPGREDILDAAEL
ncbi:MAG: hypothetical protein JWP05_1282, partial [Microbacteriaceae bacterium]|nr:hypothetical protein [Microbacteriaceae bacterium]